VAEDYKMELPRRIHNDCVGDISSLRWQFHVVPSSTRSLNAYKCSAAAQKPSNSHNSVDGGFQSYRFQLTLPQPLLCVFNGESISNALFGPGEG
jgi:hypothetical protein